MNIWWSFLFQASLSLLISGIVVAVTTPVLRTLLIDICGTRDRARFWVVFGNVMMVLLPFLMVLFVGELQSQDSSGLTSLVMIKRTLAGTILGLISGLMAMGYYVSKASFSPPQSGDGKAAEPRVPDHEKAA